MTKRKQGVIYDKWHRRIEGQIRDCMYSHPEWFICPVEEEGSVLRETIVNSLAKRIVGEIVADSLLVTKLWVSGGTTAYSREESEAGVSLALPRDGTGVGAGAIPGNPKWWPWWKMMKVQWDGK